MSTPPAAPAGVTRLAVVSHVVHYRHEGQLHAYGPYAREIDVWASLFPELVIVSPLREAPPPGDAAPFAARNITVRAFPETGGTSMVAKLWQAARAPWLAWRLWRLLHGVQAVHVRCPGNVGLLGALVAPLRSRRLVAKYAGQWAGYPGEPATVRFQRWVLRSRWWRGPVTVYGRQPGDPSQVVSFFTASFTAEQAARARASAAAREPLAGRPVRVLFVGRLSRAKRADVVIAAVRQLPEAVVSRCTIVGDGPERAALAQLAAGDPRVRFTGALPFEAVLSQYEAHDVLVLVSETEGWPKVVHEARAFGLGVVVSGDLPSDSSAGANLVALLAAQMRDCATDGARTERAPTADLSSPSLDDLQGALRALLNATWTVV